MERDAILIDDCYANSISTHALTWSATGEESIAYFAAAKNFNSRAHVERDLFGLEFLHKFFVFQLTRSRGARPVSLPSNPLTTYISTHALTWSATYVVVVVICFFLISTHALTWSATFVFYAVLDVVDISTHALTWSATTGGVSGACTFAISTHALTWSATGLLFRQATPHFRHFNSRAHVERDETGKAQENAAKKFQLTRSRGARPAHLRVLVPAIWHFNSRAHVERDQRERHLRYFQCRISTHALTWSATP